MCGEKQTQISSQELGVSPDGILFSENWSARASPANGRFCVGTRGKGSIEWRVSWTDCETLLLREMQEDVCISGPAEKRDYHLCISY